MQFESEVNKAGVAAGNRSIGVGSVWTGMCCFKRERAQEGTALSGNGLSGNENECEQAGTILRMYRPMSKRRISTRTALWAKMRPSVRRAGEDEKFAFRRAVSRLLEMQTSAYSRLRQRISAGSVI